MKKDIKVNCPTDAICAIPKSVRKARYERFGVIFLNRERGVISSKVLFMGTIDQCNVDLRVVMWEMARKGAAAAILYHNHPSGSLAPSDFDNELTKRFEAAFALCGFSILDHIIVTKCDYWSYKEHGALTGDEKLNEKVADLLGGSK